MSEEKDSQGIVSAIEDKIAVWSQHRLVLLLIGSVVVALILTTASIAIYNGSGAAQLDLSRPGYRSVSDQIELDTTDDSFSASGAVTKDTIHEFIKLYDEQATKAKAVDAFNGDPLNPEVLEFGSQGDE